MRHREPKSWLCVTMLSIAALCLVGGCAFRRRPPTTNVIMFDPKGHPMDPTGNTRCEDPSGPLNLCNGEFDRLLAYREIEGFDQYMDEMFGARRAFANESSPAGKTKDLRVVLFIHGGLNDPKSSLQRVIDKTRLAERDGVFPVFINWQSSLPSSYLDHLVPVRNGEYVGRRGLWSTPLVAVADTGRALVKAPLMWGRQGT